MAQPRIAAQVPVACAGCFGQYPDRVHVDYQSVFDGPQVDSSDPRSPHVDWVVLCDDCVRAGYELLPEQSNQREHLKLEVERLKADLDEAQNYASSLEDALQHRPAPPAPKAKPKTKSTKSTKERKSRYEAKAA